MAFGFGFNKQKVLSAAEKFVQQGKLQNAIAEYDRVLKHDDKDLTVSNTIGDLYARLGDNGKAIECFKKVGDAYAAQGFTVKGIAMYKKIAKLQPSVDSSLKLAELYTQQGLFNDARAQYLQVAEDFTKNGDLEQAVRLFQKVLEMDPENVAMRVKLAEVYIRLGKKKEAWEIFSAVAESLRARGSLAAAEDVLNRMLTLDPGSSYVLLLRGKAAVEGGDAKNAIGYLEKASDLDSHPEGLRDLLKAYLQVGNLTKAAPIAEKLLTVHNDPEGLFLLGEGCGRLGQYQEALTVYTRHADRLLATDSSKLLAMLHAMIAKVRDDSVALEALLRLLNKAGESTHVNEVTELLAHALVEDGNLGRARELYQTLATTEPQNALHLRNHQQVVERMVGESPAEGITAEEAAVIIEELEATAPVVDQPYADEVALAVRSAVTDADLFLSYNLPDKAIVPLLAALPRAPQDARLNQRLAALHNRFRRFTEAGVCCRTLESLYRDAGYPDEAVRYGELAARYEKNAEAAPEISGSTPAGASAMGVEPANAMAAAASAGSAPATGAAGAATPWAVIAPADSRSEGNGGAHPEFAIQEMAAHALADADLVHPEPTFEVNADLASEWENSLSVDGRIEAGQVEAGHSEEDPRIEGQPVDAKRAVGMPAVAHGDAGNNAEIAETADEMRFYLEHFMTEQAKAALEKIESLTGDESILNPLRVALTSVKQAADEPAAAEIEIPEINADEVADFGMETTAAMGNEVDLAVGYQHESAGGANSEIRHEATISATPAADGAEAARARSGDAAASDLPSLVAELNASLGDSFPQAVPPASTPTASGAGRLVSEAAVAIPVAASVAVTGAVPVAGASSAAVQAAASAEKPAPTMSYGPVSERPLGTQADPSSGSIDLSEMFGELKRDLEEEPTPGDDDPETHYNLGVAFREMNLLDEAIAEFQKVCHAIDHGKTFSQTVQTYTWLAQCFLDKGVPVASIHWYEKALNLPGLDEEGRLAINYELALACESAQDKPAALRHFTDVYSANIDYRDVAERILALKS
jgi:tetratricopeptide (TPR) repeat protein